MALCHSCYDILRYGRDEIIHRTCRSFLAAVDQGCYPQEWEECDSRYELLNCGGDGTFHVTCLSFLAAVDRGCYICRELFRQAPGEWKQEIRKHVEVSESPPKKRRKVDDSNKRLKSYERSYDNSRYVKIWLNLETIGLNVDASSHGVGLPKDPIQIVYPVAAESPPWTFTSLSTNSEETFTKIKSWLGRCEKKHRSCRSRRNKADVGWHPTRLIEIASDPENIGREHSLNYRIVETKSENMPQDLRYITLSHRWPQDQQEFQKLTVDKLPLWKASLPVKMLSQTFRDALFVAQRLGVSYLWIDSLCIIQEGDDYADWKKESPVMQKVYSNAEFNICASRNDQNGGLFSQRNPSGRQPLQVELPSFEEDNEYDGMLDDKGHYLIREESPFGLWCAEMNDSPLASRGWVFQEQLLSRANIHFGDHEVLFECLEQRASESLGSDQDYELGWGSNHTFLKEHLRIPKVMEGGSVSSSEGSGSDSDYAHGVTYDNYKLWHDLLGQYTTLHLTKSGDRLVAMSGVAQHFKKSFAGDDCYIAGLWFSRLATDMLWQLTKATSRENWEKHKTTRHHLTFSWASARGQVENKADIHSYPEYVDHLVTLKPIRYRKSPEAMDASGGEVQPFKEDIFSMPSPGTIEIMLTGFLRPMSIERIKSATNEWQGADSDLVLHPWSRPGSHGRTRLDFEISSSDLAALNQSGRLFMIPLIGRGTSSKRLLFGCSVWLLLLELAEGSDGKEMGRFRRIGVHDTGFGEYDTLDQFLTAKVWSRDSLSKLPCWRYDDSSDKHTIFVI